MNATDHGSETTSIDRPETCPVCHEPVAGLIILGAGDQRCQPCGHPTASTGATTASDESKHRGESS